MILLTVILLIQVSRFLNFFIFDDSIYYWNSVTENRLCQHDQISHLTSEIGDSEEDTDLASIFFNYKKK